MTQAQWSKQLSSAGKSPLVQYYKQWLSGEPKRRAMMAEKYTDASDSDDDSADEAPAKRPKKAEPVAEEPAPKVAKKKAVKKAVPVRDGDDTGDDVVEDFSLDQLDD